MAIRCTSRPPVFHPALMMAAWMALGAAGALCTAAPCARAQDASSSKPDTSAAQATATPAKPTMPATVSAVDLSGVWLLNQKASDDPTPFTERLRTRMRAAMQDQAQARRPDDMMGGRGRRGRAQWGGDEDGGAESGSGGPRSRGGPGGPGGPEGAGGGGPLADLLRPSSRLLISQQGSVYEIEIDGGRTMRVTADGQSHQLQSFRGQMTQTSRTVDGAVVVDTSMGSVGSLHREYRRSADGHRLTVLTQFDTGDGSPPSKLTQVYDEPR